MTTTMQAKVGAVMAVMALAGGCAVPEATWTAEGQPIEPAQVAAQTPVATEPQAAERLTTAPSVTRVGPVLAPRLRPDLAALLPRHAELPSEAPVTCVPGEPTATVFTAQKPEESLPVASTGRYSIYSTPSVYLAALVRNLCGARIGAFDLFAPDGSFYKRLMVPFTAEGEGTGARRVENGWLVETALPIAGTDIAETPLVGTWSVNFGIEDNALALGLALFEITR